MHLIIFFLLPLLFETVGALTPSVHLPLPCNFTEKLKRGWFRIHDQYVRDSEASVVYRQVPKSGNLSMRKTLENATIISDRKGTPAFLDSSCFFTFVREPFDRFCAGFFTILLHRVKLQPNLKYASWASLPLLSEGQFERFLNETLNNLLIHQSRYHVFPQMHFLTNLSGIALPFTFIGRLENLENDWQALRRIPRCSGVPDKMAEHGNPLLGGTSVDREKFKRWIWIHAQNELRRKLCEYLRVDYECLGYPWPEFCTLLGF